MAQSRSANPITESETRLAHVSPLGFQFHVESPCSGLSISPLTQQYENTPEDKSEPRDSPTCQPLSTASGSKTETPPTHGLGSPTFAANPLYQPTPSAYEEPESFVRWLDLEHPPDPEFNNHSAQENFVPNTNTRVFAIPRSPRRGSGRSKRVDHLRVPVGEVPRKRKFFEFDEPTVDWNGDRPPTPFPFEANNSAQYQPARAIPQAQMRVVDSGLGWQDARTLTRTARHYAHEHQQYIEQLSVGTECHVHNLLTRNQRITQDAIDTHVTTVMGWLTSMHALVNQMMMGVEAGRARAYGELQDTTDEAKCSIRALHDRVIPPWDDAKAKFDSKIDSSEARLRTRIAAPSQSSDSRFDQATMPTELE